VPVCFGSDAHKPEEVGMNFPEAISLAREAGYTEFCRFEKCKRQSVKF
jgi:histidinol-phosphatase (PHP family)